MATEIEAYPGPFYRGRAAYVPEQICGYLKRMEKCDRGGSDTVAALLKRHVGVTTPVELIDESGKPAYLESSNPRNISLYQRHGFEVLGEIRSGAAPMYKLSWRVDTERGYWSTVLHALQTIDMPPTPSRGRHRQVDECST